MCGIYGILLESGAAPIPDALVDRVASSIRHRGPDHSGRYTEPGLAIGTNRLAILDLTTGDQPIFNEDGSLVIVYNGELYNYQELRADLQAKGHVFKSRTDTEVALHCFEEYGAQCVLHFNGMFALAIWDRRRRRLFLARDPLGIKPLYHLELPGLQSFASEAKALLALLGEPPRPDWTAINRYFTFGYIPSPDSPFVGIRKLPAGHYAWVEQGRLTAHRYWTPQYGQGDEMPASQAASRLEELLEEALRRELMSDVPVGVFLSGGLDSSAVAVFAGKHSKTPLHSYALRFPETTHDESADARLVAEHLGLQHQELLFTEALLHGTLRKVSEELDEPFGDSTVLPLMALSEFARQDVRVVLTGWGGDEIFAGYPTYTAHRLARYWRGLPRVITHHVVPPLIRALPVTDGYMNLGFKARRFIQGMNLPPEYQHFLWMGYLDEAARRRLFRRPILEQIEGDALDGVRAVVRDLRETDLVDRIMHLDAVFFLEGNGLFQADRITMPASLEARVPLLNLDLLNFVNALPSRLKAGRGNLKALLKRALAPHLPQRILNKSKKGFGPPSAAWVRGPLARTIDQVFAEDKVRDQGVLDYDEIRRLVTDHRDRRTDNGRALWALLSFQLWYDKWVAETDGRRCVSHEPPVLNQLRAPASAVPEAV